MSDIAKLLRERIGSDFDGECHLTEAEALEAVVEIERLRTLLATIILCHDEGTGLLDCMDNSGARYTSQALIDAIAKGRAALRKAAEAQ
jgi:hypothetical protein